MGQTAWGNKEAIWRLTKPRYSKKVLRDSHSPTVIEKAKISTSLKQWEWDNLTGIWHSLRAHAAHLQPPWVPVMFLARPKLSEQQPKRGSQLTFHSQRVVFVDIIPVPAVCSIPHTNINKVLFDEELQSSHYNNISDWWRLRNGCRYTRVMSVLSKKKKNNKKN